ncbi:hypothetical protein [Kitasatospora sp. NPDC051914]|uniref:hypothetical protein n=1 Tax=Kitasatospora sp. NPDC051914 TaxID=3154945 RepID=UPI00342BADE8
MPLRPTAVLCCTVLCGAVLLSAVGCTTVSASADRAVPAERTLDAAGLRAAAVTAADLGAGWSVTVMRPEPGRPAPAAGRETADVPACQPVLDALAPDKGKSGPLAETDLSVAPAGRPRATVYAGLLAFEPGRAEQVRRALDVLLTRCRTFRSTTPVDGASRGPGAKGAPARPVTTLHRLERAEAAVPEGVDAVTAFTLTGESGGIELRRRAVVARVGTALAFFSTLGTAAEPAPVPDERIVRAQAARLRAAQRG